jgi:hypothetical protein
MSVLHTGIDLLSVTLDIVHASRLPARSADGEARGVDNVELRTEISIRTEAAGDWFRRRAR